MKIKRSFCPIKFQAGPAILLDGEAGEDCGETGVAEVKEELCVIVSLDLDRATVDGAFRNGHACECRYALDGPEPACERGEIIDPEIEKSAASRSVKPIRPIRTGPAVSATRGDDFSQVLSAKASGDGLECWAQDGKGCADEE